MFDVAGQDVGRHTLAWNLGPGSRLNQRTSLLLDYVGERFSRSVTHGLLLGVAHAF
ncbi:hypothetical protein [Frateuria defendens]|uniref:hypothetical protein n=1 Tax=Frateuria defendens TaxID=2219559 RepID=UPI001293B75A|nr:hypothetical protein [Frateuria defendens]